MSEMEALPVCKSENGNTISSSGEAPEEKHEKFKCRIPSSSAENTEEGVSGEVLPPLLKDVEELKVAEIHANSCQNWADWEHAGEETACGLSAYEDCVHFLHTESAASLRDKSAGTAGENSELHLKTRNGVEQEDQPTGWSEGNCSHTQQLIPADFTKPFDSSNVSSASNCTLHSLDNDAIILSANEEFPVKNVFNSATTALGSHTRMGMHDALNFVDISEHQLPVQGVSTAVVVSTDLEGWQRFDAEETEKNGASGLQQTIAVAPQNQLEPWEQLLEDVLDGSAECTPMARAPLDTEISIESSIHEGSQFWLTSPGNPFIEGLARPSNFSEADGFVTDLNFVSSQSVHEYEVDGSLIQTSSIGKYTVDPAKHNMGNNLYDMHSNGSRKSAQQRYPSFSDIRRSSSRPRDSSFPSFKEQEPVYNAHGYEAGGDKWEAKFDLVAPAIHECPRSLSLHREAGESERQGSFEAPAASQSKLSSFLSPKLSPLVKKVASKVGPNPDQVMDVIHQGKGSKAVGKKLSQKWTWRSCICCYCGS
ncbi:hypothetical protein L7F22_049633 [Adiantum nelumboides]|nr:hypothetical protein [Adiantum nelumboides]